jgi:hypothetical protein
MLADHNKNTSIQQGHALMTRPMCIKQWTLNFTALTGLLTGTDGPFGC